MGLITGFEVGVALSCGFITSCCFYKECQPSPEDLYEYESENIENTITKQTNSSLKCRVVFGKVLRGLGSLSAGTSCGELVYYACNSASLSVPIITSIAALFFTGLGFALLGEKVGSVWDQNSNYLELAPQYRLMPASQS